MPFRNILGRGSRTQQSAEQSAENDTPNTHSDLRTIFEWAGASIMGADHFRPLVLHNCQDSHHVVLGQELIVAVVCDGCTTGFPDNNHSHTEIGAQLGSRLLARELFTQFSAAQRLNRLSFDAFQTGLILERVRSNVLTKLGALVQDITCAEAGESLNNVLTNYCMFTVVATVIGWDHAYVFNVGDGTIIINGYSIPIGPFPENKPPYIGYSLTGSSIDPELLKFKVQWSMPTYELRTLLLGSDAVAAEFFAKQDELLPGRDVVLGPVDQFWEQDSYFRNADALRRKLALANRVPNSVRLGCGTSPLFNDDLTIVTIRRKPPAQPEE